MIHQLNRFFPRDMIEELLGAKVFLLHFLANPVNQIKRCPDWRWRTIVFLQVLLSVVVGLLSGIVARSVTQSLSGIVLLPINYIVGSLLISGFFYYLFLFGFQRACPFKKVYTLVALSGIFHLVLLILAPLLPPVPLVGLAFSALLLVVGFAENFSLDRTKLMKVLSALYLAVFVFWIISTLQTSQRRQEFRNLATPESLDLLEKEMRN